MKAPFFYSSQACSWLLGYRLIVAVTGLCWACNFGQPADFEQRQTANLLLTETLHQHLNRSEWQAAGNLCAETVRYRSQATHFTDVDESRAKFLAHYHNLLPSSRPGSFEIRQMYSAGLYHVIVEGIVTRAPPDTAQGMCLIYTIEDQHITRLYAY